MSGYFLGIDLGTSALKLSFLSSEHEALGPFSRDIPGVYPHAGWAEQEPELWYGLLCELLPQALAKSGIGPSEILAVAIDAATHTTVLLDEGYSPLRPAIMWNDQRAAELAASLARERGAEILETTYHPPGAMWSLCQNLWVARNQPELWSSVQHMLFAKDYLRFRLTGEYVTDSIDAQGSQFYDLRKRRWSAPLCELMGFDVDSLPRVQNPTDPAGTVTGKAAEDTGLKAGTRVLTGTTDTAMEILAAGAADIGQATLKLATSGRICVVTDRAHPHPQLVNYSHVVEGLWYPGTGTRSCATSLRWFRDNFAQREKELAEAGGGNAYRLLDESAAAIGAGAEGLFFHPYLLGEFTPYSSADLRASFVGAGMRHTRAHFARAVLEGTAYSLRDCMRVLEALDIGIEGPVRLIGGGSASALWAQITADVLGRRLQIPRRSDSSFGSAMLAAVGSGHFSGFREAVSACAAVSGSVDPRPENVERYDRLFEIYRDIVASLLPVYGRLSAILASHPDAAR